MEKQDTPRSVNRLLAEVNKLPANQRSRLIWNLRKQDAVSAQDKIDELIDKKGRENQNHQGV